MSKRNAGDWILIVLWVVMLACWVFVGFASGNVDSTIRKLDEIDVTCTDRGYDRAEFVYDPAEQRELLPLYLPYTGKELGSRTSSKDGEEIEVEHIVSLKEAYISGACNWPDEKKREFAKDTLNQTLALKSVNIAKSSHDIVDWQPPKKGNLRWFAHTIVLVKSKYQLRVDPHEKKMLESILKG